jgi:hypothetical protein
MSIALALAFAGCRSGTQPQPAVDRYLVTSTPIRAVNDLGGLCIAVDPSDEHGVWWWQPGRSGCASRSTGPTVFVAEGATLSKAPQSGATAINFRLGTHSSARPFVDIRLVVEGDTMRALETGAEVRLQRRNNLDIPEMA